MRMVRARSKVKPTTPPPDPNGRWYSSNSPWNVPIPLSPSIHSNNANFVLGFKYAAATTTSGETGTVRTDGSTTNPFAGSTHILNLATSGVPSVCMSTFADALQLVKINYPALPPDLATCPASPSQFRLKSGMSLEIPAQNYYDNAAVLIMDDGTEIDFYKLAKPLQTVLISDHVCFSGTNDSTHWSAVSATVITGGWTGLGYGSGYRESNTAAGGGMIRIRDFQQPAGSYWDHALAIVGGPVSSGAWSSGQSSGFIPPANVPPFSHGVGDNNVQTMKSQYCVPYGARIQLDPSLNIDNLNTAGGFTGGTPAPEWKKQYCRTMQKYGGYVIDSNSNGPGTGWTSNLQYPYQDFYGYGGWDGTHLNDDIYETLAQYLRVLDWNDPATYS